MPRLGTLVSLAVFLLVVVACSQQAPEAEWELTIDGNVRQPKTYSYQELASLRRTKLTNMLTRNPENPNEQTSWEGVTLFLLFKEPGGVVYSVDSWVLVTLADGTSHRFNLSSLRGALIALKDGKGNWLAENDQAPIRLIAPNLPSSRWLDGPVRITVHNPQATPTPPSQ
jgi:DMSO/TMAO reductase YedYZ molybdopterin-dependent catalytic subunit